MSAGSCVATLEFFNPDGTQIRESLSVSKRNIVVIDLPSEWRDVSCKIMCELNNGFIVDKLIFKEKEEWDVDNQRRSAVHPSVVQEVKKNHVPIHVFVLRAFDHLRRKTSQKIPISSQSSRATAGIIEDVGSPDIIDNGFSIHVYGSSPVLHSRFAPSYDYSGLVVDWTS